MPIEWAIIFMGTIASCVYFSYQSGITKGVELATVLTLSKLEDEGLIHFDNNGTIKSGKGKKLLGDLLDERDGE
jgi:hypothetical protein